MIESDKKCLGQLTEVKCISEFIKDTELKLLLYRSELVALELMLMCGPIDYLELVGENEVSKSAKLV